MKKLKFILLFLLVFTLAGCDLKINFNISPGTIDTGEEDLDIIPDGQYQFVPFENLEILKLQEDFTDLHELNNFNIYPKEKENIIDQYISLYGYGSYDIGAVYYSNEYDTIYIAYENEGLPFLNAYELYLVERHAIAYFESDEYRSEDLNYLKAVLIYPDSNGSSCAGESVGGCAGYGGKHGVITLNSTPTMDSFLNPQTKVIGMTTYSYEPKRDTFAHEYGHISTFYYLSYKGDESYEDYLRLRLEDDFNTVYPLGLPGAYSSDPSGYKTQPEEVLADDFVELFYYRDSKYEGDDSNYIQKYSDSRNSLSDFSSSITYLAPNYSLTNSFNRIKDYYTSNFYIVKREMLAPIVVKTKNSLRIFSYYDSVTKLNDVEQVSSITSEFDVQLIAVETVTKDNIEYYRIILSPLSKTDVVQIGGNSHYVYDKKKVSNNMGYVRKDLFDAYYNITIYKVLKGQSGVNNWVELDQNGLWPVLIGDTNSDSFNIFVTPYYDFTYIINLGTASNTIFMYDYLMAEASSTQKFRIIIDSLVVVD